MSENRNRSESVELKDGEELAGDVYIWVEDTGDIEKVEFYLDNPALSGAVDQLENNAPYDFKGGSSTTPNAFNIEDLSEGEHSVSARVTYNDGTNATSTIFFDAVPLA